MEPNPNLPTTETPDDLFICDNGRMVCKRHLGHSARTTGRDISGQRIHQVTEYDRQYLADAGCPAVCESCSEDTHRAKSVAELSR